MLEVNKFEMKQISFCSQSLLCELHTEFEYMLHTGLKNAVSKTKIYPPIIYFPPVMSTLYCGEVRSNAPQIT